MLLVLLLVLFFLFVFILNVILIVSRVCLYIFSMEEILMGIVSLVMVIAAGILVVVNLMNREVE